MNITDLEQIVGPIKRGQLSDGFNPDYYLLTEKPDQYLSEDCRNAKPPPLTEDLSHLNGKSTLKMSEVAKRVWSEMTSEQRLSRLEKLSKAGKVGGRVKRQIRHMN